jgi:hypothetical protein
MIATRSVSPIAFFGTLVVAGVSGALLAWRFDEKAILEAIQKLWPLSAVAIAAIIWLVQQFNSSGYVKGFSHSQTRILNTAITRRQRVFFALVALFALAMLASWTPVPEGLKSLSKPLAAIAVALELAGILFALRVPRWMAEVRQLQTDIKFFEAQEEERKKVLEAMQAARSKEIGENKAA